MTSLSELFARLEDTTSFQPAPPKRAPRGDGFDAMREAAAQEKRAPSNVSSPAPSFECEESTLESGNIPDADTALRFITAGNATFTIRSRKTGTRFTYKVRATEDKAMLFVSLLSGPDNETAYQYFGNIRTRNRSYWHGKKAKISEAAPAAKAFAWTWHALVTGKKPDSLEIWHEGRCGRCGRKLTVPESIATGFGPECAGRLA